MKKKYIQPTICRTLVQTSSLMLTGSMKINQEEVNSGDILTNKRNSDWEDEWEEECEEEALTTKHGLW